MFRKSLLLLLICCPGALSWVNAQEGYSIDVTATGAASSTIRLAYHLGNEQYIKDSTVTDITGRCFFRGDKALPPGVYMIVFPGNKYFEFLAGRDQHFSISYNISDPEKSLLFRGSDENTKFLEYQRNWKAFQEEMMAFNSRLKGLDPDSKAASALRADIASHEEKMKRFLTDVYRQNQGTLLGAIAQSLIPVENHPPAIPQGASKRDSLTRLYSYLYAKDHFFDNTDLTEPGLIRTPVLASRLDQFFRQVVVQIPDSVIKEADLLLEKSSRNKDVYQFVAAWLFNRYAKSEIMGHDAVVVHLADKVYLSGKATWVTEEYKADLAKRVERLRPNLIGRMAPDLVMNSFDGRYVSLHDIKAEFTIIYFWEPDCGHCKESTPVLKKYFDENRDKGIAVFAVCTQPDKEKWEKYIIENKLQWINGWDPARLTRFDLLYNVDSTPILYILDRDKKIIAKRLPVEKVSFFIDSYRQYIRHSSGSEGR